MWYDTGTVQVTAGSNAVVGTNTAFIANVRVGDAFRGPDGRWYQITNIASNTAMAIKPNYEGPSASGSYFSITPVPGYNQLLAQRVTTIIDKSQVQSDAAAASATAALASQNAAKTSETNSKTSETRSVQAEVNAGTHAANALASKNAAGTSEVNARGSEVNAGTHAANALASRNAAAQSATDAANTLASKANKGANSDITSLSGLTTPLSQAQGGTGDKDGKPRFAEVGANKGSTIYNQQGLYMGWNSAGFGEGHFIVNKGGGSGGFSWRSVNLDNSASGPSMTFSYDGLLTVPTLSVTGTPIGIASGGTGGNTQLTARNSLGLGPAQAPNFAGIELFNTAPYLDFHYNNSAADYDVRLINQATGVLTLQGSMQVTGRMDSAGTWCRAGLSAARGGTVHNLNWTGSNMDVWVDNTYVGTMTLFQSDYRFKKNIKNLTASFLERVLAYRVVTYERKNFGEVFTGGDGIVYQGLIAHEAKGVNPLAASGEKDGLDQEGNARIQQLDPMALVTDLMGGFQEFYDKFVALEEEVKELRAFIKE